jgi:hypothetical protein
MANEHPYIPLKTEQSELNDESVLYDTSLSKTNVSIFETAIFDVGNQPEEFESRIYETSCLPEYHERDNQKNNCCFVSFLKLTSKLSFFRKTYNLAFLCCLFRATEVASNRGKLCREPSFV